MSVPVRILALSQAAEMDGTVAGNIARYEKLVKEHVSFRPDFIVFPETATALGGGAPYAEKAATDGGASERFFAGLARESRCYVVGGYVKRALPQDEGHGSFFNCASLFDRTGRQIGTYRKTYPTGYEYTGGAAPGPKGQPALSTEFGPVGLAICYDANFGEIWTDYGKQGVRIVFWISAYPGGALLNAHAVLNGYYIVTATHPAKMRLIDPLGRNIALASPGDRAIELKLDLDEELVHMDYANLIIEKIKGKYASTLTVEEDRDIGWYRFRHTGDGPSLKAILAEFGLLPLKEFLARERRDIDRQRSSGDAPHHPNAW